MEELSRDKRNSYRHIVWEHTLRFMHINTTILFEGTFNQFPLDSRSQIYNLAFCTYLCREEINFIKINITHGDNFKYNDSRSSYTNRHYNYNNNNQ